MEEELSHVKPNNNSQAEVTKSHRPYLRWWPYLSGKEGAVTWEKKKKKMGGSHSEEKVGKEDQVQMNWGAKAPCWEGRKQNSSRVFCVTVTVFQW